MRTLSESEWVPAAGEPEYPPHIGSGSFEPEPPTAANNWGEDWPIEAVIDGTESEPVEDAPITDVPAEPEIVEPTPEPYPPAIGDEADVAATDGEPAGEAEAPADPEPPAEG